MVGVQGVSFISKEDGLQRLREQMRRQASLLEDLKENPLPDAFEIRMDASFQTMEGVEALARQLEAHDEIEDVEYGQKWLGRFSGIFDLFRLTGYGLGGLFFLAAVFIVANTARLVLYSRRQEIEVMRLVGATDGFIQAPLYLEGLLQGIAGGVLGLASLWIIFLFAASRLEEGFPLGALDLRYLSAPAVAAILGCSMLVGWLGCFLALRQSLRE
jgi:cell division transport system permease protein